MRAQRIPPRRPAYYTRGEAGRENGHERHSRNARAGRMVLPAGHDELRLAAKVETELRAIYPCEVVKCENGVFVVDVDAPLLWESRLCKEYNRAVRQIPGVKGIKVHIVSPAGNKHT